MGAADRTVQRLYLRAPSAQAAVRAVHRLEDALRCASLPDAGERVLLVRRLHLGRLPEGLSSQSLSLLIEQRVAAVGGEWVHGDDEARAAHSDTVFFACRLQAAQAALRRRARGESLLAWHWPLALPRVAVQGAGSDFLVQLLDLLAREPWAATTLSGLVAVAVRQGGARWLVRHMDAGSAAWLVEAVHAGESAVDPAPGYRSDAPVLWRDERGQPVVLPRLPHSAAWLARVLHAAGWQVQISSAPTPGVALVDGGPARLCSSAPTARTPVLGALVLAAPEDRREPVADAARGTAPFAWRPATLTVPLHEQCESLAPVGEGLQAWPRLHATAAGGLLFLLPVIDRVAAAPLTALQWRCTLESVLHRLRLPEDDAAWGLLGDLPLERDSDRARAAQAEAMQCLHAARRLLRRQLRIGLASLVLRAARLEWSATHWDVHFDVEAADLRVRRAGLDIDPGWCEGLGRVVGFHYGRTRNGGHGL